MTIEELHKIDKILYEKVQEKKSKEQAILEAYFEGYEKGCDDFRKAVNDFLLKEGADNG